MTINEQLTEDMKASMRDGQTERTGVLRLLRGALKNEEIKLGHALSEAEVMKVLQREAKQRRDAMAAYVAAGRAELAAHEETELVVISEYLPQAMSEAEVMKVIEDVIAGTGATSAAEMGVVIGGVMKQVGARADGGLVSRLVRERLGA